jgi:signal transduction histidine kinase
MPLQSVLIDALDAMGEAIAIWDKDDRLLYYNENYQNLFKLKDEIYLGVQFKSLVQANITSNTVLALDGVCVHKDAHLYRSLRMQYHQKAQGLCIEHSYPNRWLQIKERKFNDGMRVGVYTDISEQKAIEHLLAKAKNELEIANQVKNVFLTNITHELKTPLHAILSYAQLLQNNKDNHLANTQAIISSAQYLTSMIDDMLQTTKNNMDDTQLDIKPIKIKKLIADIKKMFSIIVSSKNLDFIVKQKNIPEVIYCDERKVKQIIINLLGNAIKFTHEGSITFEMKGKDKGIKVLIKDTGIGIDKHHLHKIFNAFEKLNPDMNSKGMGLGLNISNGYAKLIYSDIKVRSTLHKGSTFSFIIPYAKSKKKISIKKNIDLTQRVSLETLDVSSISKQEYKKIKHAVQHLYYSELKGQFSALPSHIRSPLLKRLESFEWEELAKIFT